MSTNNLHVDLTYGSSQIPEMCFNLSFPDTMNNMISEK